mmetsp:Transcript_50112/g.108593  ORF Transcript_50112/g.108593 Transcript_50112/m.108593 type:complete len:379 (+) Transcript_50112:252-1388(+)
MPLSSFDVYPKTLKEFRQRTLSGAIVSIGCAVLIMVLTSLELIDFATVKTDDHLYVDTSRGQTLRINVDIEFPSLPCSVITIDTLDLSGNHAPDLLNNISKTRLDRNGAPLDASLPSPAPAARAAGARRLLAGDGQGNAPAARAAGGLAPAKGDGGGGGAHELVLRLGKPDALLSKLLAELLPNVFEDKEAIEELRRHVGEGCRIAGFVTVNRVAGNFHFALNQADQHTLMTVFKDRDALNVSHHIHSVSFGEPYPGMVNPLDRTRKDLVKTSGYFQYYIKVVPTTFEALSGEVLQTNQYTYTELFRTTHEVEKMPAVYFHYEISPIMAKFSQRRRPLGALLTTLCAIIGGVFTVAGMIDSCIHRSAKWYHAAAGGAR